jgi:hypothetical protein
MDVPNGVRGFVAGFDVRVVSGGTRALLSRMRAPFDSPDPRARSRQASDSPDPRLAHGKRQRATWHDLLACVLEGDGASLSAFGCSFFRRGAHAFPHTLAPLTLAHQQAESSRPGSVDQHAARPEPPTIAALVDGLEPLCHAGPPCPLR